MGSGSTESSLTPTGNKRNSGQTHHRARQSLHSQLGFSLARYLQRGGPQVCLIGWMLSSVVYSVQHLHPWVYSVFKVCIGGRDATSPTHARPPECQCFPEKPCQTFTQKAVMMREAGLEHSSAEAKTRGRAGA